MRHIEVEHPAVIETIRRILARENLVPKAHVRDFDGNEFCVVCELPTQTLDDGVVVARDEVSGKLFAGGSVTVSIAHALSPAFFETSGAKPFLNKVLQRHFAHDPTCFTIGSSSASGGTTVTVKLATDNMTVDEVVSHPTVRKASQLRLLVLFAPFLYEFEHFLVSKNAGQDVPFMALPFVRNAGGGANDARMYLYSANANFVALLYLRIPDTDERIFVRTFLSEMQLLSGNASKGLAGCVGASFVAAAKAPSLPAIPQASVVPAPTDDSFFVTFVISKRHMDPVDTAERAIRMVVDFRAYLLYHVHCCKSNLHAAMRARADASLQVINRAKTKTTGRPRIAIE
jgi:actin related protein 2/3 complex subunit 2